MKIIYLTLLAVLSSACMGSNTYSHEDFYGTYGHISGDSDYEKFALLSDGEFLSWHHHRPAMDGTWSLINGVIYIKHEGLRGTYYEIQMQVIKLTETEAVFMFDYSKTPAVFDKSELYSDN